MDRYISKIKFYNMDCNDKNEKRAFLKAFRNRDLHNKARKKDVCLCRYCTKNLYKYANYTNMHHINLYYYLLLDGCTEEQAENSNEAWEMCEMCDLPLTNKETNILTIGH